MVFSSSIEDPTEEAIQKMIEGIQRTITIGNQTESLSKMNPVIKRHLELEIRTLQNAPRDEDKLERLLKSKEKGKGRSNAHGGDRKRLVTEEIEMLKVVLYLVSRSCRRDSI
jgi:hypothetical protein